MGFGLFVLLGVAVAGAAGGGGAGLAAAVERFVFWALGISTKDGTVHAALEAAGAAGGGAGLTAAVARFVLWALGVSKEDGGWAIAHAVFMAAGSVVSVVAFAVPWYTAIAAIRSEQSTGQRSCLAYVAALINCILWVVYGLSPKGGYLIAGVNLFGVICEIVYLYNFWKYTQDDVEFHWGLVSLASGLLFVVLGVLFFWGANYKANTMFLTWACALCRGTLPAVPLVNLPVVFRQRNLQCMPSVMMSNISLGSATIWIAYACTDPQEIRWNSYIFWPSVVGAACASIQIVLHIVFRFRQMGAVALEEPLV